jgi:hypothetical protein
MTPFGSSAILSPSFVSLEETAILIYFDNKDNKGL